MENIVLTVHLILAALLIGVVLLQRSEGGGLGMGGSSGGGSGVMTGRQAANALSRLTWILAIAFLATSLTLTIIAARNATTGSVLDQLNIDVARKEVPATGLPSLPDYAPPPPAGQPVTPPSSDPVTPPAPEAATPPTSDVVNPVTPPAATGATAPATTGQN